MDSLVGAVGPGAGAGPSTRPLGRTGLAISPLGLGCWQFSGGKGLIGGFWEALPPDTVEAVVAAALAGGMNWFDTAEAYGNGASEEALAGALRALGKAPGEVLVATKWWPILRRASHMERSIDERLSRLGGYPIDLYQIHSPLSLSGVRAEMKAMARLVEARKIRSVGVSNYTAGMMRRAHQALAERGIPLASNQVLYSLLNRKVESNGIMETAKDLGISIIAYSPLGQGILTGAHHEDPELIKGRPGPRKRMPSFSRKGLERTRPLVEALRGIGERHGATPVQVALNWLLNFHGETVVAIPGASRSSQVKENLGALAFRLEKEELTRIDEISGRLSRR